MNNLTFFFVLCMLYLVAVAGKAEERHATIQCDPNGTEFTCVAINIEGIDGVPTWTMYTTPMYIAYGPVATEKAPTHWTLLRFTIQDKNNNVKLSVLVRQHKGRVEFAASDSPEQKVEK